MIDKEKLEFVEQVMKEIREEYPEEFEEVVGNMAIGYNGELFNDKLFITWCIEDVKELKPTLTEEQCKEVLSYLGRHHSASEGINWDIISTTINMMDFEEEEEEEEENFY